MLTTTRIPRPILKSFKELSPDTWSEIKRFAAVGFTKQTGLATGFLDNTVDNGAIQDYLEQFMNASEAECLKILRLTDIYVGSQYLEVIDAPFPRTSSTSSAEPLATSSEVGLILLQMHSMIINDDQYLSRLLRGSGDSLPVLCFRLKKLAPTATATNLLSYLVLREPVSPQRATKCHHFFAQVLGEPTPRIMIPNVAIDITRPH
jgi:hypothetical protein